MKVVPESRSLVSWSLALAAVLAMLSAQADTWYQSSNSASKGRGWYSSDSYGLAGIYWTNSKGEVGTGPLVPTDDYWNKDGRLLRAVNNFEGGNLTIGDTNAPNYSCRLQMDGNVAHPNGTLTLAVGYAFKGSSSTSSYNIYDPIIASPKDKPFGFYSRNDNVIGIKGSFSGGADVGFLIGGYFDGEKDVYSTATNTTVNLNPGLADYHGEIRVICSGRLQSPGRPNLFLYVPPCQSDASLEIENGVEFLADGVGEIKLSNLTAHADSYLYVDYNSSTKQASVIRVTGTFSIPEDEGQVELRFASKFPTSGSTTDEARLFPILVVPISQELDANRFVLQDAETLPPDERRVLRVVEDVEAGTKTLVYGFLGKGKLDVSDKSVFSGASTDFSVYSSALTNATSWSNDRLPHENAIYEFGDVSGYGSCIRTPYLREEDYVFPGEFLRTIGASATFVLADETKTTVNFDLTSPLSLRVIKAKSPTLAGTIRMGADVDSCAWNGSVLTIDSKLSGPGNWTVIGTASTGSPHSKIVFTADNSEWTGALALYQSAYESQNVPSTSDNKHQKLILVNPKGLGGKMGEMNYKALLLADYSELIVTNSVTLAGGLNRGIFTSGRSTFSIDSDAVLTCQWPLAFDGTLLVKNGGTLRLGGSEPRFADGEGAIVNDPPADTSKCIFDIYRGVVDVLSYDCLNGVTINPRPLTYTKKVVETSSLFELPFNASDVNLRRYGLYNVKSTTPFVEGQTINIRLADVDATALEAARLTDEGYKQGLITVKTTAAKNVEDNLVVEKVEGLRLIREDDAETETTTFSLYGKKAGILLLVR